MRLNPFSRGEEAQTPEEKKEQFIEDYSDFIAENARLLGDRGTRYASDVLAQMHGDGILPREDMENLSMSVVHKIMGRRRRNER